MSQIENLHMNSKNGFLTKITILPLDYQYDMTNYVYFDLHENFVCLLKLLTTSYLIKSKFEQILYTWYMWHLGGFLELDLRDVIEINHLNYDMFLRGTLFFQFKKYMSKNIRCHILDVGQNYNIISSMTRLCLF